MKQLSEIKNFDCLSEEGKVALKDVFNLLDEDEKELFFDRNISVDLELKSFKQLIEYLNYDLLDTNELVQIALRCNTEEEFADVVCTRYFDNFEDSDFVIIKHDNGFIVLTEDY